MTSFAKYYREDLSKLVRKITPPGFSFTFLKQKNGRLFLPNRKYDYWILNNLIGDIEDIQANLAKLPKLCTPSSRIIITYYNHLWEPILKFATFMGWRKKTGEQNWLDNDDLANLLNLSGFEVVTTQKRMLIPTQVPLISDFVNKWISPLPLINTFCLTTWIVARPKPVTGKKHSASIIVPARNEEGNIPKIIPSIPKFGKWQEIIFVEGHSRDATWEKIQYELGKRQKKGLIVKSFKQKGKGKADAVRLGFEKASGEILMIYDADRTVEAKDLTKFYQVLASGIGEFANGSRLVYPMQKDAMRILNKIGNKTFSWLFTWILGQRFKDTLCGTKALFKKDYEEIKKEVAYQGKTDPFGDFDLIFGAVRNNLKVMEIPVRYKERVYGSTNISRVRHGLMLFKMTLLAFREFKAW